MSTHTPEHELFLERLVAGDEPADAPHVRARLASCAECARVFDALTRIGTGLDDLARTSRHDLAPHATADPFEERVQSVLRSARASARPRASRWTTWRWLALAAAAGLVAWIAVGRSDHGSPRTEPDVLMGATEIDARARDGRLDDVHGLEFGYVLPAGGRFHIYLAGRRGDGSEYTSVQIATGSPWRPSAALLRELPEQIRVHVTAVDASDSVVASSRALSLSVAR